MSVDLLLSRLDRVRGKHPKYMARCPAHDDNGLSLSIKAMDDGRILVHCFAGCGAADVMESVGLSLADLFPEGSIQNGKPLKSLKNRSDDPDIRRDELEYLRNENYKLKARASA